MQWRSFMITMDVIAFEIELGWSGRFVGTFATQTMALNGARQTQDIRPSTWIPMYEYRTFFASVTTNSKLSWLKVWPRTTFAIDSTYRLSLSDFSQTFHTL